PFGSWHGRSRWEHFTLMHGVGDGYILRRWEKHHLFKGLHGGLNACLVHAGGQFYVLELAEAFGHQREGSIRDLNPPRHITQLRRGLGNFVKGAEFLRRYFHRCLSLCRSADEPGPPPLDRLPPERQRRTQSVMRP